MSNYLIFSVIIKHFQTFAMSSLDSPIVYKWCHILGGPPLPPCHQESPFWDTPPGGVSEDVIKAQSPTPAFIWQKRLKCQMQSRTHLAKAIPYFSVWYFCQPIIALFGKSDSNAKCGVAFIWLKRLHIFPPPSLCHQESLFKGTPPPPVIV